MSENENGTTLLVVDDEQSIADAIATMLRAPGRTVIVAYDVDAAELAVERFPVTHVIADIQFSKSLGFEGIRLLDRIRALRPGARVVTLTGYPSSMLRKAASARGVVAFVEKPCDVDQLRHALGLPCNEEDDAGTLITIPAIDDLISRVTPYFQPIVSAATHETFGFEALARIEGGWALGSPEALFAYAQRHGRIVELNRACVAAALRAAAELPPDTRVFVNVDAPALCARGFAGLFDRAPIDLSRVVIEISESFAITDDECACDVVATLRGRGMAIAFDDIGDAYSHFPLIAGIQPEFLKISRRIGSDFERDPKTGRLLAGVVALAHAIGSSVVLEGIETAATAAAAHELGIELVQGYWYGRPSQAKEWRIDDAVPSREVATRDTARHTPPSLARIAS